MTSDRPYRSALPVKEALRRIREASTTQFDPEVVLALERALTAGTLDIPATSWNRILDGAFQEAG
jgi:HD-GYP domain-containing protein (c-di-GMP phosphodiesterase class II)